LETSKKKKKNREREMFLEVRSGVAIGLCFWRKCGKYLTNMTIYIKKKLDI
jgi:hypothetical protein